MSKHLRVEARPAAWEELDETQKDAFREVVEVVSEAIEQLPRVAPQENARDPFQLLELSKSSRTVFLSGDRGTGKTTVLLSIIKASLRDAPKIDKASAELSRRLENMKDRAVWLETLDMETMPA